MGLLDAVVGALGQGQQGQGAGQGELLNAVIGMLGSNAPGGGLAGLVARFEQGGLGNVIASWISSGQNLPVSADQLHQVLGSDAIGQLAQQLGLGHGDVAAQLSQLLPQVVDHLTPQGELPAAGAAPAGDLGSLLGGLLGR